MGMAGYRFIEPLAVLAEVIKRYEYSPFQVGTLFRQV